MMPISYYRTAKGKAEYAIRSRAHDWITIDGIQTETGLPRRAIRDAMIELAYNNVLVQSGEFKNGKQYRYTEYWLSRKSQEAQS